jgi:ParB-like chromosome segregation protein Spo0J
MKKENWPADKVTRWPIERLIPYARNPRTHTPEQVAQIAASMREWGWTIPVLADDDGGIIAGHGRVLAARQLGFSEVPVIVAAGWTESQKRAEIADGIDDYGMRLVSRAA